MAVFRVEKTKNYTVMSNHHLRNKDISLKAKGLLSLILSLPESWDYTLVGLSLICKEGIDAVRTAVKELEEAGYIERNRARDENGKFGDIEYVIYENPKKKEAEPEGETPVLDNPTLDEVSTVSDDNVENSDGKTPILENPMLEKSISEKPTQENRSQLRTDLLNTDLLKNQSINQDYKETMDRVNENISYETLCEDYSEKAVRPYRDLMVTTLLDCSANNVINIGKSKAYASDYVRDKLLGIDMVDMHIKVYVQKLDIQGQRFALPKEALQQQSIQVKGSLVQSKA